MGMEGFANPDEKMARIRQDPYLSEQVEAMASTVEVVAMLQFYHWSGEKVTRPVHLIGVDPSTRSQVGGFKKHLVESKEATFEPSASAVKRYDDRMRFLRDQDEYQRWQRFQQEKDANPDAPPPPVPPTPVKTVTPRGAIVGNLIASFRYRDKENELQEEYVLKPGDEITLTTVGGEKMTPVFDNFIVVDYFKSDMSEYDSQYVFVPLDYLQHLRTMGDRVTSIQLKLKDYSEAKNVVQALQILFKKDNLVVQTWEDKQGPLLQAIAIEKGILNVLLFMIIAVAGFGILAIFSMIVAEKTRDIGILKSLGASNGGVMKIFLGYGLLLGVLGAVLGSVIGVYLTQNINEVEKWLTWATGQELFDRKIYYFNEIPTNIQPLMIVLVNLGAVLIAVLFSVLPAMRAALLHPVRALRYE
jgi:lipoprotein-releasing system permease protein